MDRKQHDVPEVQDELGPLREIFRKAWNKGTPKTPQKLYHYRGREGTLGILRNQLFQATNARHIKGAEEIDHAAQVVVDQLQHHHALQKAPTLRRHLIDLPDGFRRHFDGFLTCFSVPGNDPGQWELYGKKGFGFALEVDIPGLVTAAHRAVTNGQLMLFDPVCYDEGKLRRHTDFVVDEICRFHDARRRRTPARSWVWLADRCARFVASELSTTIALCKPKRFENEQEWRLWESLARNHPNRATLVKSRAIEGSRQEYVEFRPYPSGAPPLPITSIRCGAKVNVAEARDVLGRMANEAGLASLSILAQTD